MSALAQTFSVVVAGQGYVGLPIAMAAVDAGFTVTGIDLDPKRVALLREGKSPIEDISSTRLEKAIEDGLYFICDDYSQLDNFDFAVITVPTPLRQGLPDLSFIESSARSLASKISTGCTIILESTTYPGTTEELLLPILEKESGLRAGVDFFLGYSPERIDPGNRSWNLLNTPKIVSGITAIDLEKVSGFYSQLGITTVPVSGTREAEMTKLLENTFRHVNIALVNELARFSHHLEVDIWEAINAAATKPFGFMKFTPGPGVGGHCLPIDPSYLSWAIREKSGESFKFVELANEVNEYMPHYVMDRLQAVMEREKKVLSGSCILLVGLAYKENSGDVRESPAIAFYELLRNEGASIYALDDWVEEYNWPPDIVKHNFDGTVRYDAAVLLTDHANTPYEWLLNEVPTVLDTKGVLSGLNVERL